MPTGTAAPATPSTSVLSNALLSVSNEIEALELRWTNMLARLEQCVPQIPCGAESTAPKDVLITSAYVQITRVLQNRIEKVNRSMQFVLDNMEV